MRLLRIDMYPGLPPYRLSCLSVPFLRPAKGPWIHIGLPFIPDSLGDFKNSLSSCGACKLIPLVLGTFTVPIGWHRLVVASSYRVYSLDVGCLASSYMVHHSRQVCCDVSTVWVALWVLEGHVS